MVDGSGNPQVFAVSESCLRAFLDGNESAAFSGAAMRLNYLKYWHEKTRRSRPMTELCDADFVDLNKELERPDEAIAKLREQRGIPSEWGVGAAVEDDLIADTFLAIHESIEGGDLLAAFDGVFECRSAGLPPPDWLCDALKEFLRDLLSSKGAGGKGRGNSPAGRVMRNLADRERVEMVDRIRSAQKAVRDLSDYDFIRELVMPPEVVDLIEQGEIDGIGKTAIDAIAVAELALRGTRAQASAKTIYDVYYSRERREMKYSAEITELVEAPDSETFRHLNGFGEIFDLQELADQHYKSNPPPPIK